MGVLNTFGVAFFNRMAAINLTFSSTPMLFDNAPLAFTSIMESKQDKYPVQYSPELFSHTCNMSSAGRRVDGS